MPVSSIPFVKSSNNLASVAPSDGSIGDSSCSIITNNSKGNWYSIIVERDICLVVYITAPFEPAIAVHEGQNCQTMTCLAEQQYTSVGFKWMAKDNTSYQLFIGGVGSFGIGEYTFTILPYVSEQPA
jgi:1-deoxy-D-xylulose 5-phosphate reductoisomerase